MDPNTNGNQFVPAGSTYVVPNHFPSNGADYTQVITGPTSNVYQPPTLQRTGDLHSSPSSSNQSFPMSAHPSPALDYSPVTPPHLTHSRGGSRESAETSSSNSTPSSGAPGSSLVHRTHGGRSRPNPMASPTSPLQVRKIQTRKNVKKSNAMEEDDEGMSDEEGGDPVLQQKMRREDAKKSRQDAEQKRRDQLKGAYDMLRGVVPGTSEKTSKVLLVTHARQYIERLSKERDGFKADVIETNKELESLRHLNERLMNRLGAHNIDFQEDLKATGMVIPPDDEPGPPPSANGPTQRQGHSAGVVPSSGPAPPQPIIIPPQHRPSHYRTGSDVTGTYHPMHAPHTSVPMSAPLHTASLPPYPAHPASTPASPTKPSNVQPLTLVPVGPQHPGQLSLPYQPVMQPIPSPSSSSSSIHRQSIYSQDDQSQPFYSTEDPSSANSSSSGLNVSTLSIDEWHRQQQAQGSTPQSPGQGIVAFNGQAYPPPPGYHPQEGQFVGPQGFGDPGLGLHANTMHHGMDPMHDNAHGPTPYPMHEMGNEVLLQRMPGAFPQDDSMAYGQQPMSGVTPHPMNIQPYIVNGEMMYHPGPEGTPGPFEYGQQMLLPQEPMSSGPGNEVFLQPKSPNTSQGPSPPTHGHPGFITPNGTGGPRHMNIPTPTNNHGTPTPGKLDSSSHMASPMPPHSPSGRFSDPSQSSSEAGIAPSMIMGGADSGQPPDMEKAHPGEGVSEAGWYQPDPSFAH